MQRSARSPHPPLSVQALGQLSDDTIICDTPSLPTESRVAGIGVLVLNPGQLEPGVLYLPLGHEITFYNSEEVSSRTQQSLTAISLTAISLAAISLTAFSLTAFSLTSIARRLQGSKPIGLEPICHPTLLLSKLQRQGSLP